MEITSKEQLDALSAKLKAEVAPEIAEVKALFDKLDAVKNEDFEKANSDLNAKLKSISDKLSDIEVSGKANKSESAKDKFFSDLETKKADLKNFKQRGSGVEVFTIKAAGVTGTVAIGADSASLTNTQSAASSLYEGGENIYMNQRVPQTVLDFVTVTTTDTDHITYRNEETPEGDFAITAEGATKPLRQYKFSKKSNDAVKVAGHTIITDEFERNYSRLWALIQQLMAEDCNREMADIIITDMITQASPYSLNALDDLIDNADNYAAIGAVVCQLQLLGYNPNVLALNPADAWAMRLQKDSTGQYILPPFSVNGQNFEFGRVYVDANITQGNFFLGDGSQYRVETVGDIIVRMGYINDQLITNEMTLVVERYFHNYIPAARRAGFVYANFAAVIADIEMP